MICRKFVIMWGICQRYPTGKFRHRINVEISTTVTISSLLRWPSKYSYVFQHFFDDCRNFDVDSTLNQRRKCPLGWQMWNVICWSQQLCEIYVTIQQYVKCNIFEFSYNVREISHIWQYVEFQRMIQHRSVLQYADPSKACVRSSSQRAHYR